MKYNFTNWSTKFWPRTTPYHAKLYQLVQFFKLVKKKNAGDHPSHTSKYNFTNWLKKIRQGTTLFIPVSTICTNWFKKKIGEGPPFLYQ